MPRLALPRSAAVLGLTLGLMLACGGGVSIDPETHMEPICRAARVDIRGDLVQLDAPVLALEDGVPVTVGAMETTVDGVRVEGTEQLAERLVEKAEVVATLRFITGTEGGVPLLAMIAPDVPSQRVGEVLRAAHSAGLPSVDLVVWSTTPLDLPPYPDPAYAEALKVKLAAASPDVRQVLAAEEITGLISLCPPMQRAFEAVAYASPDQKCEMITAGMAEALPACIATDGDKVLTAVQLISEPRGDFVPTAVRVKLDPEGAPIEAVGTWADLAPKLAARQGETVWVTAP